MITSKFDNFKILGIAAAVPTKHVESHSYDDLFGKDTVDKNIASTGICGSYHVNEVQTSGDLGYEAAKNLLNTYNIDPKSIGIIIFCGSYFDYIVPPTACVLHGRLGMSQDCMAFDIDLGCSGYVYGLQNICSVMSSTNITRGLLITGDVTTRMVSPLDKSRMLFGDGGTATLIEKCDSADRMSFGLKTDGSRFKSIIIPSGAQRNLDGTRERVVWGDGNTRSDYDLYMNGTEVFSFTMTDVPKLVKEFWEAEGANADDYDSFIFHQPNLFIMKHVAKKLKMSMDKLPLSLDEYGNTSVCAIPVTICKEYGNNHRGKQKLFLYGFGVGLSWACASITLDTDTVLPIIHTDESYTDGQVDKL